MCTQGKHACTQKTNGHCSLNHLSQQVWTSSCCCGQQEVPETAVDLTPNTPTQIGVTLRITSCLRYTHAPTHSVPKPSTRVDYAILCILYSHFLIIFNFMLCVKQVERITQQTTCGIVCGHPNICYQSQLPNTVPNNMDLSRTIN